MKRYLLGVLCGLLAAWFGLHLFWRNIPFREYPAVVRDRGLVGAWVLFGPDFMSANTRFSPDDSGPDEYRALIDAFGEERWIVYRKVGELAVVDGDVVIGTHEGLQHATEKRLIEHLEQVNSNDMRTVRGTWLRRELEKTYNPMGFGELAARSKFDFLPSSHVTYFIDPSLSSEPGIRDGVQRSIAEYEAQTPVRFTVSSDADSAASVFRRSPAGDPLGCYTTNLSGGRAQRIVSLSRACAGGSVGTISHEIGHALGFMHEHTRLLRSEYVSINETALIEECHGRQTAFCQLARTQLSMSDQEFPVTDYDLCSIMHYPQVVDGRALFSLTPTGQKALHTCASQMPARDDCRVIGQRCTLSPGDVLAVRRVYGAPERNQ